MGVAEALARFVHKSSAAAEYDKLDTGPPWYS